MVVFETTLGNITIKTFPDKAPISVENFLKYVDGGYFDDTIFHRVIPGFMVQGGGFTEDMAQKTTNAQIKNEADNGLSNDRGTLAMARTSDVNSATSQFFINLKDNDFLNHGSRDFGYAVFAEVSDGMDVVEKIAEVKTGNNAGHGDVPVEPIKIISAKRK
jgi:peptidyl-prolyl cis-trans isomerase A (cyclophilin A)